MRCWLAMALLAPLVATGGLASAGEPAGKETPKERMARIRKAAGADGAPAKDGDDAAAEPAAGKKQFKVRPPEEAGLDDELPPEEAGGAAGRPASSGTADKSKMAELPKCEFRRARLKRVQGGGAKDSDADVDPEIAAERVEYEKAVERYVAASQDVRGEVRKIVVETLATRRKLIDRRYTKAADDIELTERDAREQAIRRFEAFIKKYPNDPKHTPDAMFRLAELYFERSAVDYADSLERYEKDRALFERGKIPEEPPAPNRSYADAVKVYRQLLARFGSSYRYVDAIYYLLGYVLNESMEDVEARQVWQTLVKRFPKSEYAPEVILRIGEIYFDYGDFAQAAEAYKLAMGYETSKYYDKALYKLAWTYFQVYDYDAAIKTFKQLIGWYSDNRQRLGDTGQALREEAIDYLARSLAEDDWDNDGLPDPNKGVSRALGYLDSGKAWELDIVARYAKSLFDLHDRDKYREAISVYEFLIERQPMGPNAPDHLLQVIRIYDVLRNVEKATAARKQFAVMFAPGGKWSQVNGDQPALLLRVRKSVELAMREQALWFHQRAQELKTQAKVEDNPALLVQARDFYAKAATAYAAYIDKYPTEPASYEMRFYKAETMYYSGRYREAAQTYTQVARDPDDTEYLAEAAWSAIKSYEKIIGHMVDNGQLNAKADPGRPWPPAPAEGEAAADKKGGAVTAPTITMKEPLPAMSLEWIAAIDFFLDKDIKRRKSRDDQATLSYQAGEILYRYRQFAGARRRFMKVLSCYPRHEVSGNAIANIINSYREEDDWPNLEKWASLAEKLQLGDPEMTKQIRAQIKVFKLGAQFTKADELFKQSKFLEAAREFERMADENPDAKIADKAYFNAALGYQKVYYYDSAVRIFEKLVSDKRFKNSGFAADSLFQLAENYKQFFYFEQAIKAYLQHFKRYEDNANRHYMLFQAATLQEWNGDLEEAASNFERYSEMYRDSRDDAAAALYRAGELHDKRKDERASARIWKDFISRYGAKTGMGTLVVQATLKLARMAKEKGKTTAAQKLWRRVLEEFSVRGLAPGSEAARSAAESRYELAEREFAVYKRVQLVGSQKVQQKRMAHKITLLTQLQSTYAEVFPYKSLDWTICGYYRLGDLFREMANTLYKAPQPKGLSEDELDAYITLIEDEGLKFENVAIERFAVTVEKSREFKVTNKCSRLALEAINKYQPDKYPLYKEEKLQIEFDPVFSLDTAVPEAR